MKTDKPSHGSGKTRFNRGKANGQSWTELREKAIKAGTWKPGQK
jgi:hypothetical protein